MYYSGTKDICHNNKIFPDIIVAIFKTYDIMHPVHILIWKSKHHISSVT